jgi:hypothetical protein
MKAWQFVPDVEDILDALNKSYCPKAQRKALGKKARAKAEEYDAKTVLTEYMLPALEQARERFAEREATPLKVAA